MSPMPRMRLARRSGWKSSSASSFSPAPSSLIGAPVTARNDSAAAEVQNAVTALVQQALADTSLVKDDVLDTIDSMIARLDEQLSMQLNEIIHSEEFQQIESAWRGLHYLVNNTETDESLKIRVMNISKGELHKTLKKYKGTAWDQSPIFKKLYEEEFGQFGGEPYGSLIADYYFDNSAPDVELLAQIELLPAPPEITPWKPRWLPPPMLKVRVPPAPFGAPTGACPGRRPSRRYT